MKAIVFPGQGSQRTGMGSDVFDQFPELVATADAVLGFSIRDLCLINAGGKLDKTAYTQPAIYVVSLLRYYAMIAQSAPPSFVAGHSVGEYAALTAAGVFDFATGLRIVQQRGLLMGEAFGGGLVAVLGLNAEGVKRLLAEAGISGVEIANINSPAQVVVGGRKDRLQGLIEACTARSVRAVPLRVSGAFHTSHMVDAAANFGTFLNDIRFASPKIAVISNVTGLIHEADQIRNRLTQHMVKPVLWLQSIETMLNAGVADFVEAGTPPILAPIISDIRKHFRGPAPDGAPSVYPEPPAPQPLVPFARSFCRTFGCSRPAIAGSLGNGMAGPSLVRALAKAKVLSFLDTEGLELQAVDDALAELSADAEIKGRFGAGLRADLDAPDADEPLVDLFLKHDIRFVEAKGYHEPSRALLRYRTRTGKQTRANRVIAHAGTIEAASAFILGSLVVDDSGKAPRLPTPTVEPWADALCVDLHAWRSKHPGTLSVLQAALEWRDLYRSGANSAPFFVGAAGGPSGPEAVKALLATTVDFISAGSIYLMANEASLDDETRQAIRRNAGGYEDPPDWHFPELASRSLSFVRDHKLAQAAERLQALYGAPEGRACDVEAIAFEMPEPFATRLRNLAASLPSAADSANFRASLRRGLRAMLFPGIIACDASPAMFAKAMQSGETQQNQNFGAAHLAELLCPVTSGSETQTEKRYA